MNQPESLARFTVPWGQQEIELQALAYPDTAVQLLRVRIREGKRFTIFDIDAATAQAWAAAMAGWAGRQAAPGDSGNSGN